ncbi:TIGR03016 family PEP-CTERM system-associated outer membrane protein [Beggiatoa alba]|nr:TIGR03016 family PEP-CTERM system-associated outer membrane protein [Beggiatoa alba]
MKGSEVDTSFRINRVATIAVIFLLQVTTAYSGDWLIEPTVTLGETYTDNVTLSASGAEQEEYITEITPGISLTRKGRRLELALSYQLQKLLYSEDRSRNAINHKLLANANGALAKKHYFFDSRASIGQRNIASGVRGNIDNLSAVNRAEVKTIRLSPYYQNDFGGAVEALARYTLNVAQFDTGATDTESHKTELNLSSGREFARTSWRFRYNNVKIIKETANNTDYESYFGELGYKLNRRFTALMQGGIEENNLGQARGSRFKNGDYWAVGLGWRPNTKFRLDMLYGEKLKSIDANWNPTPQTSFQLGWSKRGVGLNTGSVWNGSFSLRTRRTQWRTNYSEITTTIQQLVAEVDDSLGSGQQGINSNDSFGLSNEIFIRKRGQVFLTYKLKRSTISISVYNEQREFQQSDAEEVARGGRASLNWKLSPRSSLIISTREREHSFSFGRKDKLFDFSVGMNRKIGNRSKLSLKYRYLSQQSSDASRDYDENRITLNAKMRFI